MIKLHLNIGRDYDGYGEQVVKKETICLTDTEAAMYLTQFIEAMGVNKTKEWLKKAKTSDPESN
tara:strand:+ start:28471 stop:28662 length:192 start_codon:yes stop_codon:yes gene_type:complete